jgi:transcriptional regulator with XRE-family HTH domain
MSITTVYTKSLTDPALAERVGIHVSRFRRYEGAGAQPTLDVLRRLAVALSVSADRLVFDTDERGPEDDLLLHLEAVRHLSDEEKQVVKTVIESVLLRHEARRYAPAS